LQKANTTGKQTIATFGGAWSNHIVATAFAAREAGLQSVGIIRGEKPAILSATLLHAESYGMQLVYVTREEYRHKELIKQKFANKDWFWINEGGYGSDGAKGASEILKLVKVEKYTHILAAVGTGTMLAGLINSSVSNQQVIGISSMKGNNKLQEEVERLLPSTHNHNYSILHDYHFGGYGKHPEELINFINSSYHEHKLPLDIVYTGKTFFAIKDLASKSFFKTGSQILMIHSGGLQGNKSLPAKVLAF